MAGLQNYYFFPTDFFVPPLYPDAGDHAPIVQQPVPPIKTPGRSSTNKIIGDNGPIMIKSTADNGDSSHRCFKIVKAATPAVQAIVPLHHNPAPSQLVAVKKRKTVVLTRIDDCRWSIYIENHRLEFRSMDLSASFRARNS
ncbi:hypothetical protein Nepgr_009980 [Nepenthes gracilis]|uniref:Uncharacterized protein n=1 Tax=Nepenthes gracilis TaxID=150966 RepID=A0AAD3SCD2_NEPGR|nr:hypothetical protein Nepgr_009980 [Nepenthes gracilis]